MLNKSILNATLLAVLIQGFMAAPTPETKPQQFGQQGGFNPGLFGGAQAQGGNSDFGGAESIRKWDKKCKGPSCSSRRFTLDWKRIKNGKIQPRPDYVDLDNPNSPSAPSRGFGGQPGGFGGQPGGFGGQPGGFGGQPGGFGGQFGGQAGGFGGQAGGFGGQFGGFNGQGFSGQAGFGANAGFGK